MNRRLAAVTLLVAATSTAARAQDGPPTFVPHDRALMRVLAEDVPALLKLLPGTALGRLVAEPDVGEPLSSFVAQLRARHARADAVRAAASALGIDGGDADRANRFMRLLELQDCQRLEAVALTPPEGRMQPATVILVGCTPKAEGKATRAFEAEVQHVASGKVTAVPDAKIGGVPAHMFTREKATDRGMPPGYEPLDPWFAHFPGVFVFGEGALEECGTVAPAPRRAAPHASIAMDVHEYAKMIMRVGAELPAPFDRLGGIDLLEWRLAFAGELILDEIAVTLTGEGQLPKLLADGVKLPAQPLPAGAIVQLRCALDVAAIAEMVKKLGDTEHALPVELLKEIVAATTGGVAIGVAAPAPGGLLPRVFVSLGVADGAAMERLLTMLLRGERKQVAYDGVDCTVVELRGAPSGLQPAYCTLDGVLHLAECGASLRAFLKARAAGGDAMDVGDAPVPAGNGEAVPGFDLRSDAVAMYRAFRDVWLPAYELLPDEVHGDGPVVKRSDMPPVDVVGKHAGKSRGVLRRDGNRLTLQQLGALGGVEAAALAMTWGPMIGSQLHRDWSTDHLSNEIGKLKLATVYEAIDKLGTARPATLGELFVAAKLPDDALLVPGDALAEDVAMPAGDARKVKTSFRFFPDGVTVNERKMLFVAIAPRRYGRIALAADGTVVDLWGDDSTQPIGQFK